MTTTLLALAVIALAAFTTEGAIGFGGTVIAASVGAQLIPLEVLLPAFVPLNLVLSSWLMISGWRSVAWRFLFTEIAAPVAVGAAVGLALFHLPAKTALALGFGVFVTGLAVLQLVRPLPAELAEHRRLARGWQLAFLVVGGVAHGLFGTGGPMVVYVARRRLPDKRVFRATLAVLWLTLNIALLINFLSLDLYDAGTGRLGLALAVVFLPGLMLGERIHRALDAAKFERVVWVLLLAAGVALSIRSAINL